MLNLWGCRWGCRCWWCWDCEGARLVCSAGGLLAHSCMKGGHSHLSIRKGPLPLAAPEAPLCSPSAQNLHAALVVIPSYTPDLLHTWH